MYKATRDFIRDRQPFAKYAVKQVSVQQLGGGEDGNGYMNAHRRIDRERNIKIVSGWLVRPHDKALNKTEIVQHWWNVDAAAKTYFDVSPGIGRDCEYVLDMDLAEYGIRHFESPAEVAMMSGHADIVGQSIAGGLSRARDRRLLCRPLLHRQLW